MLAGQHSAHRPARRRNALRLFPPTEGRSSSPTRHNHLLGAMVIGAPTAPVKKLLRGCKNREIASISILNERYTRLRIATTLRFCSSQGLKHHSNFRPILAALGRGAGRALA